MVFTNNVLVLLAGACQPNNPGVKSTSNDMVDINGIVFAVQLYSASSLNNLNVSARSEQGQIGKGTTPAFRTDLNIETPFTNGGQEDNRVTSVPAFYIPATELIELITTIPTSGSGTITEVCKFVIINDNTGVDRVIMISRDIISPGIDFVSGQNVNMLQEVST